MKIHIKSKWLGVDQNTRLNWLAKGPITLSVPSHDQVSNHHSWVENIYKPVPRHRLFMSDMECFWMEIVRIATNPKWDSDISGLIMEG